jgi:carboxylesterase
MAEKRIITGAEPFYFSGGRIGCILTHGFTGTPKEMRWLGEYLSDQGFSVIAPRLAGHATDPHDMARSTWQDWQASVEDAYFLLEPNVDQIYLIGLSMGGMLSLIGASIFPVDGVITISTPYEFPVNDWRLKFIRQFAFIQPHITKGAGDWHNPEAARDHIDYPYNPTRSVAELKDLFEHLKLALPTVNCPALIIQSRADLSVPFTHLDKILTEIGSKDKASFVVENSGHVIIREPDRFVVFEKIKEFILLHAL